MAGKPGMKGGGGRRPGAGRKPKEAPKAAIPAKDVEDSKAFLRSIMADNNLDLRLRLDAAKTLLPFEHQKLGEGGKKGEKDKAARAAAAGRFAPPAGPKLVVNNR